VRAGPWVAALLVCAVAAGGGEPPQVKRLTDKDRRDIHFHLESCSSLELDLEELAEHVRALVKVAAGRDDAVEHIIDRGLSHREAQTRMAAAEALAIIGNRRALEPLNRLVEFDPDYTVRRHALRALAGFGDPTALAGLFRDVPDFDGSLRRRILSPPSGAVGQTEAQRKARLRQLGQTISRALDRYESLIGRMSRNVDPDEKERAVRELQRLTGDRNRVKARDWIAWWRARKGIPPPLHSDVNRKGDRTTMMALIEVAGLIRSREALPGMIAALRSGEGPVRMAAAATIGTMAPDADRDFRKEAVSALREALKDSSGWVRASAAKALTAADAAGSAPDFEALLPDWAPGDRSAGHRALLARVRRAAVAGLRAAQSRASAPRLAGLLLEPEGDHLLAWDLVTALSEMGSVRQLPTLARFSASADARERTHALKAMRAILKREKLDLPDGELRASELKEERLRELSASKTAAQAVAAVCELDRRGLLAARRKPSQAPSMPAVEARILTTVVLALRKWAPAVKALAETAVREKPGSPAALAACRAAGEVGGDEAVAAWIRSRPAGTGISDREVAERRRSAAETMLRILQDAKTPPQLAGCAAGSLSMILPAGEDALKARALAALVGSMANIRLRSARAEFGAALRRLSGETYADDPASWARWWRAELSKDPPDR
jgi:HEAT repeat protein